MAIASNIFEGQHPEDNFYGPAGWLNMPAEYPDDPIEACKAVIAPLVYGRNTRAAADTNSKVLADLANEFETGRTIILANDFVFNGLELPTKLTNGRADPVPLWICGAMPSVKVLNINPNVPAAFYFDNGDVLTSQGRISFFRNWNSIQRFENLSIHSKSSGIYIRNNAQAVSLHEVHFVGCAGTGLHLSQCFKLSLPPIVYAKFCDRGFCIEGSQPVHCGQLAAADCRIGIEMYATGITATLCAEANKEWNVLLRDCEAGNINLYQEGVHPQLPGKSRFTRCRDLDFRARQLVLDSWQIEMDDFTKEHCTINGREIMATTAKMRVGFVVKPGVSIVPGVPPEATVGEPFAYQFAATGGSGNYVWQKTSGDLPPGVTLSPSGFISGVPTQPGNFEAEITVSG